METNLFAQLRQNKQQITQVQPRKGPIKVIAQRLMSWDALGVIIPLLLALIGWFLIRRKRSVFKNYFEQIDTTFREFKTETDKCEAELYRLKETLDDELKKSKLEEGTYQILTKRIDHYLKEVKKAAVIILLIGITGMFATSHVYAQSRTTTPPPEFIPFAPILVNPAIVVPPSTSMPQSTVAPTSPPRTTPTPTPTVTPTSQPTPTPTPQPSTQTPVPTPTLTPAKIPLAPPILIPLPIPSSSPTASPSASPITESTSAGMVAGVTDTKPVEKNPWEFIIASLLLSWILLRRSVRIVRRKNSHRKRVPLGCLLPLPLISELYELYNNYRDTFGDAGKEK